MTAQNAFLFEITIQLYLDFSASNDVIHIHSWLQCSPLMCYTFFLHFWHGNLNMNVLGVTCLLIDHFPSVRGYESICFGQLSNVSKQLMHVELIDAVYLQLILSLAFGEGSQVHNKYDTAFVLDFCLIISIALFWVTLFHLAYSWTQFSMYRYFTHFSN